MPRGGRIPKMGRTHVCTFVTCGLQAALSALSMAVRFVQSFILIFEKFVALPTALGRNVAQDVFPVIKRCMLECTKWLDMTAFYVIQRVAG